MAQKLKTNFFELLYQKGSVRWIKNNGIEIVRMIYSAVRDHNWGTIEPETLEEKIFESENGFQVETRLKYQKNDIHFEAFYRINGNENRLEFEMTGTAKSTFKTNRVGFCVLHPIRECSGKICTVYHPNGSSEILAFPDHIAAHQPMKNIKELEWYPSVKIRAKLYFFGDIFEMEDQRNWTDASYKTYCRPLALPFPFELTEGETIQQKIVLELECEPLIQIQKDFILIKTDKNLRFKIPEIGVGSTSRSIPPTKNEVLTLNQFSFGHLRAEIHLFNPDWKKELAKCSAESKLFKLPLFLILYFSENHPAELEDFSEKVIKVPIQVKYILVVTKNHLPSDSIFESIYPAINRIFPKAKIGTGVNAWFAELNRNRPQSGNADFVSFAVCPQIHAFDNFTMVENLEAQQYVVESAKNLFAGKPVFISPVTLKQRFNVVATSEEPGTLAGELPPQVDVRQNAVFTAQWMIGSLKFLSQAGADLVTYFETVGWRGFIQGDFEPPMPDKFLSHKGEIFPVFRLLTEFSGFDRVVFCESSSPLEVDGIVLEKMVHNGKPVHKVLLANFTSKQKKVKISGFEGSGVYRTIFSGHPVNNENGVIEIEANDAVVIFFRS